jgi:hypothetical protein
MSKFLDKHSILAADDASISRVDVPEWGGHVFLKTLSVADGIEFQSAKEGIGDEKVLILFLTYALCDEAGVPIFARSEIDEIARKNPHVIARLGNAALSLNKMTESDDAVREGE